MRVEIAGAAGSAAAKERLGAEGRMVVGMAEYLAGRYAAALKAFEDMREAGIPI